MAQNTVKIVADVRPEVAALVAKLAKRDRCTKRVVIESAILAYSRNGGERDK